MRMLQAIPVESCRRSLSLKSSWFRPRQVWRRNLRSTCLQQVWWALDWEIILFVDPRDRDERTSRPLWWNAGTIDRESPPSSRESPPSNVESPPSNIESTPSSIGLSSSNRDSPPSIRDSPPSIREVESRPPLVASRPPLVQTRPS